MDKNSQFTMRREMVGGQQIAPNTMTGTSNNNTNSVPDPNTTTDPPTDGNAPNNNPDTATTTTVEDKPTTVTEPNKGGQQREENECSAICKMHQYLSLGMSGAFIIFLLALAYQALKSVGKAKE